MVIEVGLKLCMEVIYVDYCGVFGWIAVLNGNYFRCSFLVLPLAGHCEFWVFNLNIVVIDVGSPLFIADIYFYWEAFHFTLWLSTSDLHCRCFPLKVMGFLLACSCSWFPLNILKFDVCLNFLIFVDFALWYFQFSFHASDFIYFIFLLVFGTSTPFIEFQSSSCRVHL